MLHIKAYEIYYLSQLAAQNALLPNDYKLDLKECFVIEAGYGDMSSERV